MDNIRTVEELNALKKKFDKEVSKIVVGQKDIVEQIFIALLCNGHIILEGVPGLAKTLLIKTFAKSLELNFSRIQFTPDLMPSDITGTEIIQENKTSGKREFIFYKGPLFSNIVLADEINRTPPKTQSALLQSMQEYKVTIGNKTYDLDKPFFVFATQNPIEQEGTYQLPEAQLDRFMFNVIIQYPSKQEEKEIVKNNNLIELDSISPIIKKDKIITFQNLVRNIPVSDNVINYAVKFVRNTRNSHSAPKITQKWLTWGAGPRATSFLILASKAYALLQGKTTPDIADIQYVMKPILRHRIIPNFNAEAEGMSRDNILDELMQE